MKIELALAYRREQELARILSAYLTPLQALSVLEQWDAAQASRPDICFPGPAPQPPPRARSRS